MLCVRCARIERRHALVASGPTLRINKRPSLHQPLCQLAVPVGGPQAVGSGQDHSRSAALNLPARMAAMTSSGNGPHETTIVCYHYPCNDGIYSALAAHLHFAQQGALGAVRFVPLATYNKDAQLELQGHETVYLCDFIGPPGFALRVAGQAKRVVVLDHHKTAAEELQHPAAALPPNLEVNIDMGRSGAAMARDYFKPQLTPQLEEAYRYIEDADLWRWAHANSAAFSAGFGALKLELDVNKNPHVFEAIKGLDPRHIIEQGEAVLQEQAAWVQRTLLRTYRVRIGGAAGGREGWGSCLAVELSSEDAGLRSKLGNELAAKSKAEGLQPMGIVAYREPEMTNPFETKLSCRSIDGFDTTMVTKAFGGGGHQAASACVIPVADFAEWRHGQG